MNEPELFFFYSYYLLFLESLNMPALYPATGNTSSWLAVDGLDRRGGTGVYSRRLANVQENIVAK